MVILAGIIFLFEKTMESIKIYPCRKQMHVHVSMFTFQGKRLSNNPPGVHSDLLLSVCLFLSYSSSVFCLNVGQSVPIYLPGNIISFLNQHFRVTKKQQHIQSKFLNTRNQDHFNYPRWVCFAISISVEMNNDTRFQGHWGWERSRERRTGRKDKNKILKRTHLSQPFPLSQLKIQMYWISKYVQ